MAQAVVTNERTATKTELLDADNTTLINYEIVSYQTRVIDLEYP